MILKCATCKAEKSEELFNRCGPNKHRNGRGYSCRDCSTAIIKEWRSKNRAYLNLQSRQYKKRNKEKIKVSSKLYRERNKEYIKERYKGYYKKTINRYKETSLLRNYGLTFEEFQTLLNKQNKLCAICNQPETAISNRSGKVRTLAVDHCHKTNKVRGLLCFICNSALGHFKDNIPLLESAIDYLKAHSKVDSDANT